MKLNLMDEIPIDAANTLDQTTARFQGVRDGLPELVKNSKDQYARLGVASKDDRQIVVVVSSDERKLAVLDFGGAKLAEFEGWLMWSGRTGARRELADDIEAGYGNGGKSFMVRGAVRYGYMVSSCDGRLTKMGFENDVEDRRYRPGWGTDHRGKSVRNVVDRDARGTLNRELEPLGISIADLPPEAQGVFKAREYFTLVVLDGVKDWHNVRSANRTQRVQAIPEELAAHPQAALTIESSTLWVMVGDRLLTEKPLAVAELPPFAGFEEPRVFTVPDHLTDPETGEDVNTGPKKKFLELRTSARNLRVSDRTKPLNVIRVHNRRNIVANYSVANLVPFAASAFVHGKLQVPALEGEHLAGTERQTLADTALARALEKWVAARIEELALEIQRALASSESDEDRSRTNQALSKLRELMRRFLEPRPDSGSSGHRGKGEKKDFEREFGSIVHEIELENGDAEVKMAVGTTVPLVVRCFELREGEKLPVKAARLVLRGGGDVVAQAGRNSVTASEVGSVTVQFETEDGSVRSNAVTIEAVEIASVTIMPPTEPLKQGERRQLHIEATDAIGAAVPGLVLDASVDEQEMGSIGRSGVFTAGRLAGDATVRVKYGTAAVAAATLVISEERVERKGHGGGPDIPQLLLCGDIAPNTEDWPEDQRTMQPSDTYPTIIEFEPQFENVVWLNHGSRESMKVRTSRGHRPMSIASDTFVRFLVLKAFEVLKHLKVQEAIGPNLVTSTQFLQELATAELDVADFMDAAEEIVRRATRERAAEESRETE